MKIIVDNKIPYIKGQIEKIADEVVYLPGGEFTPDAVKNADALVIRTRTHCGRSLLEGSKVRFIATATIGFDHIDTAYCEEAGIEWANCPGCNVGSVEQYIYSALLLLQRNRGLDLKSSTVGIVGVGHVGTRIASLAKRLGMTVLLCDPPRADVEEQDASAEKLSKSDKSRKFVSLHEIAEQCDVVTFHTPLVYGGKYPTFHLANQDFFTELKCRPVIINTSRGEVIDTKSLLYALQNFQVRDAVIDVWENEPYISLQLLEKAYIGTPHIAGYSADGKAKATQMTMEALCRFFNFNKRFKILPPALDTPIDTSLSEEEQQLESYNPLTDCRALRMHPENFEQLRGDYPFRRER